MAVVAYTEAESKYSGVHLVVWAAMANGDTGTPYELAETGDRSVHVYGTFGTGGSVAVQGSNEITLDAASVANFVSLHDSTNTAIAITAAGLQSVQDITHWIRPKVTAGDGTTALTVVMCVRHKV